MGVRFVSQFTSDSKLNQAEIEAVRAYDAAMKRLAEQEAGYIHNLRTWGKWTELQKYRYVQWAENEAEREDGVRIAKRLVATAILLKITS